MAELQTEKNTLKQELDDAHAASETAERGFMSWLPSGLLGKPAQKVTMSQKIEAMKSEIDKLKSAAVCCDKRDSDLKKKVGELRDELREVKSSKSLLQKELDLAKDKNMEIETNVTAKNEEILQLKERVESLNVFGNNLAQPQNTHLETDNKNCIDTRRQVCDKHIHTR